MDRSAVALERGEDREAFGLLTVREVPARALGKPGNGANENDGEDELEGTGWRVGGQLVRERTNKMTTYRGNRQLMSPSRKLKP